MNDGTIILLFIKAPVAGQVKTRLAESLGDDAALVLYRSMVVDSVGLLTNLRRNFRICYHPPGAGDSISGWLGTRHQYQSQTGDDLGERMRHGFQAVFNEGFERAVIVGGDVPDVPARIFDEAFGSLADNDAVLGPAADGGYYLIGFTKTAFLPDVFSGIRWSTGSVLVETLALLSRASRSVHLLPEWRDVDSLDDVRSLFDRNRTTGFRKSKTMSYIASNPDILASGTEL